MKIYHLYNRQWAILAIVKAANRVEALRQLSKELQEQVFVIDEVLT